MELDHVVVLVDELSAAMREYTARGFTVVPGGEHKGLRTHNALIPLADGAPLCGALSSAYGGTLNEPAPGRFAAYIELIAFRQKSFPPGTLIPKEVRAEQLAAAGRTPAERRMLAWETCGPGLVDFALLPLNIEEDLKAARSRGLAIEGPFPGSRLRPDGQRVAWQFGIPVTWDLPFLCADVTARSLRVPEFLAARQHANGAVGVARIVVGVNDLEASASRYSALLGSQPRQGGEPGTVEFLLGSATVALRAAGADAALRQRMATRGEGPCALLLRTRDGAVLPLSDPSDKR